MLPSKKTFLAFSKNCHYASKGVELNLEKIALGKISDEKKMMKTTEMDTFWT
jgi:hypothetical protein